MKNILVALVTGALLSGCQLTRVEGEYQDVEVKLNTKGADYEYERKSRGSFCPPGQAKKGNC